MSVTKHIQVRTRSGYARVTLNQGKLLITFYVHNLAVDYAMMRLIDETYIYKNGWDMVNLRKIITSREPN